MQDSLWRPTCLITSAPMCADFMQGIKAENYLVLGPVYHNAPFSKVYVFVVIRNASIDSRPHYRFDAFRTVHTVKRSKTIELHVVTYRDLNSWYLLQTHAFAIFQAIFPVIVSFCCVFNRLRPSTLIRCICVSVLIHFEELNTLNTLSYIVNVRIF